MINITMSGAYRQLIIAHYCEHTQAKICLKEKDRLHFHILMNKAAAA